MSMKTSRHGLALTAGRGPARSVNDQPARRKNSRREVILSTQVDTNSIVTAREHFEALYADHASAVLAYARRRTSPGNADDVLAEVFRTVWRRLDDIPPSPRVWLLGVARRVLANQRRAHSRQSALQSRLADNSPRMTAGEDLADERVLLALQRLSEKDRDVLLLLGWEGLSSQDAARVLGIRAGTLAVRLHRARGHFAAALAASGGRVPRPTETTETMEAQ
jgi:RNA polymerase sigma-70 factor, ECF subfamily